MDLSVTDIGGVSIHARLATGDSPPSLSQEFIEVSIHARLATGDAPTAACAAVVCFNSRPSCDGRHDPSGYNSMKPVSIHARLATGDGQRERWAERQRFQFTPVLRRATHHPGRLQGERRVSIHARLATGDPPPLRPRGACGFNSRPSCDGRLEDVVGRPFDDVSIHARLATGDGPF